MRAMLPAKKGLGQNFLTAAPVAKRIADAISPGPGDLVFEIGPGHGALTVPLARSGAEVIAYEIDGALVELLREKFAAAPNVDIRYGDIREADFDEAARERGRTSYKLAGNIPYNLTGTILVDLPRWRMLGAAVLMVQREVGDRILTEPGERNCGILSIFLRTYFIMRRVLRVRPGSFMPPPKVESVVLGFEPHTPGRGPEDRGAFLQFLKGCFAHRRKKLRNILGDLLNVETAKDWDGLGELSGVDFGLRPEELPLESWFDLFAASRRVKGLR
jgi:16S rRNA (adenine1518-N6/adenine1519-N6)-dimethyltransferase